MFYAFVITEQIHKTISFSYKQATKIKTKTLQKYKSDKLLITKSTKSKFITKYPNTRYLRYVDDCFVLTTNEEENSLLFEELNKEHKSTNFTKDVQQTIN